MPHANEVECYQRNSDLLAGDFLVRRTIGQERHISRSGKYARRSASLFFACSDKLFFENAPRLLDEKIHDGDS